LNVEQRAVPPAFHVMVKPAGPLCNLACEYCYYLSKANLYPGADFRMSGPMLEDFTRQYIAGQQVPAVTFNWQGGEPLLRGLDFFQQAVALQQRYRRPGMHIINALQSNGVLLDEAWCRFFKERDFLIGISLDGPRALHNAYRRDKRGEGTFDRVMAGLALLKQHNVAFNILTTVHAANAPHPLAVYRFLRDEAEAHFIQFIPIVQRDNETGFQEGEAVTGRSVTAPQYGDFLRAIFDTWVRCDIARVSVQLFDVAVAAWAGQRPGLCMFEETCGTALVLEHNGDLYACDHFVEPLHRLGNIRETPLVDMVGSAQQRAFGQAKRDLPAQCQACEVRFVCNGGCLKNRLRSPASGEPPLNVLCEGYKAFFTHIDRPMRRIAEDVRAGYPPEVIQVHIARDADALGLTPDPADLDALFAQAGRNDPCPCGSGRKYKHCHGRR